METGLPPIQTIRARVLELAVREADVRRREALLRRAEQTDPLLRVPRDYFDCGAYDEEDEWWAMQFGSRRSLTI
ncbi:MAG TPA: hypothetical protein VFA88_02805 [Gaiellaceae bacterium]|nr:hypothetical protein [Gaiellaceae bacterium]